MWVRLDDGIAQHPKFVRAGPEALALFVAGLGYCNRYRTNGCIPKLAVPNLMPGLTARRAMELAQRLGCNHEERPSWIDEGEHLRVHDYHDYQPMQPMQPMQALQDEEGERVKKARNAERQRRFRERHPRGAAVTPDGHSAGAADGDGVTRDLTGKARYVTRDVTAGVTHYVTRDGHADRNAGERYGNAPLPEPLPPSRPVLCKQEFSIAPARGTQPREGERDLGGEFRVWFAAYPRQEGAAPARRAWLAAGDELPPLPETLAALAAQQAANPEPRYWRKAERYVRELGWRDQPLPPPAAPASGPGRAGRNGRNGARIGEGGAWEGR